MKIGRWLYLSSSPWGIPLRYDLFWKIRDPKNFVSIGTNKWITSAVWWSIKYFFAPRMLLFWMRLAEKWEGGEKVHTQMQSIMHFMQKQ